MYSTHLNLFPRVVFQHFSKVAVLDLLKIHTVASGASQICQRLGWLGSCGTVGAACPVLALSGAFFFTPPLDHLPRESLLLFFLGGRLQLGDAALVSSAFLLLDLALVSFFRLLCVAFFLFDDVVVDLFFNSHPFFVGCNGCFLPLPN